MDTKQNVNGVTALALSPQDELLAIGFEDGTVVLANTRNGVTVHKWPAHAAQVSDCHFTPDGTGLLTASHDATAKLWKCPTGKLVRVYIGHHGRLYGCDIHRTGDLALTCSEDRTAKLFEMRTAKVVHTYKGHNDSVLDCAFHPTRPLIMTCSEDRTAMVRKLSSGGVVHQYGHFWSPLTGAFSHDGRLLAIGLESGDMVLYPLNGHGQTTVGIHQDNVTSCAFNHTGTRIVSGSHDGTVLILKADNLQLRVALIGHQGEVTKSLFSKDDQYVFTGSLDGAVGKWKLSSPHLWQLNVQTPRGGWAQIETIQ